MTKVCHLRVRVMHQESAFLKKSPAGGRARVFILGTIYSKDSLRQVLISGTYFKNSEDVTPQGGAQAENWCHRGRHNRWLLSRRLLVYA